MPVCCTSWLLGRGVGAHTGCPTFGIGRAPRCAGGAGEGTRGRRGRRVPLALGCVQGRLGGAGGRRDSCGGGIGCSVARDLGRGTTGATHTCPRVGGARRVSRRRGGGYPMGGGPCRCRVRGGAPHARRPGVRTGRLVHGGVSSRRGRRREWRGRRVSGSGACAGAAASARSAVRPRLRPFVVGLGSRRGTRAGTAAGAALSGRGLAPVRHGGGPVAACHAGGRPFVSPPRSPGLPGRGALPWRRRPPGGTRQHGGH